MPRWTQAALDQMTERIVQLGLRACPVCQTQNLHVIKVPGIVSIGEVFRENSEHQDGFGNIIFAVVIQCDTCGHLMFFNSESFYKGDDPIMTDRGYGDERP